MQDIHKTLERLLAKRARLYALFAEQHKALHPDRNITAGQIFQNTKDLERSAIDLTDQVRREEYASSWLERWPRK